MYAGFGSAEEANKRYRYLLSRGSTGGVPIALDLPTRIGCDSDHIMARDEIGRISMALTSLADVEVMFDGIPVDKIGHIFTTANCIGTIAATQVQDDPALGTLSCRIELKLKGGDTLVDSLIDGGRELAIDAASIDVWASALWAEAGRTNTQYQVCRAAVNACEQAPAQRLLDTLLP